MKKVEEKQSIFLPFISLTCAIFTFLFFLANIFFHYALSFSALMIEGDLFLLALASAIGILVAICLFYSKKTKFINKIFPIFFSFILFTICIFVVYIFYNILLSNRLTTPYLWNLQLMFFVLGFSALEGALRLLKIKNYLINVLIQLATTGLFYFILTLAIFKIGSGSGLIFVIFAYLIIFAISAIGYFFFVYYKQKAKNQEKNYKKQF
ncbi:MAG: hypothetical protein IJW54_03165 [Clostridia bacterium]|nr:hypothetical protein [Clostridia bacterium]